MITLGHFSGFSGHTRIALSLTYRVTHRGGCTEHDGQLKFYPLTYFNPASASFDHSFSCAGFTCTHSLIALPLPEGSNSSEPFSFMAFAWSSPLSLNTMSPSK